jgi:glycosyltransferase involved in cell wall biosynthesis
MKFSIISPSFNQGRFIKDCIESVRSQTGVEWEHIVTDACSTDETISTLKQYPHLKWTSEPDKGMSDGINKGFLRATGDWVMWLNTDDYLLPGALARVARHVAENPTADVIYGECNFVDESKKFIRRRQDHRFDFNILLYYGCFIQSTSTFLRRSIISSGHLVDLRYKVCMDFEYYLRLSRLGYRFSFIPEALAGFRWHGVNTSTRLTERRLQERVEIQREILQQMRRPWLGYEPLLTFLRYLYTAKRRMLRAVTRHV